MTAEGRARGGSHASGSVESRLVVHHVEGPRETRVVVSGELASDTCIQLHSAAAVTHDVVLDLREVTFVDSAGLNTLLLLDAATTGAGRSLRIDPGIALRRLLELCGMTDMLTLIDIGDN